jgi:hypothetical protein
MNKIDRHKVWLQIWRMCVKHKSGLLVALLVVVVILLLLVRRCSAPMTLSIVQDNKIDLTPEEIRSVKEIGQWEFLAVTTEEMVDSVRKGIFVDDELTRIYRGTLRIGIDMNEVQDNWAKAHGDTVSLHLPALKLLDNHFVDEASTRSFYQKGTWDAATLDAMLHKAERQMMTRCMTTENKQAAERNARSQFTTLFQSFGFHTVEIDIK